MILILVNIIMRIDNDCNENWNDNNSDYSANYDEDDKDSELKIKIVVNFCFVFGSQLLLAWHFNENYKQSGLLIILCQFTINPPFSSFSAWQLPHEDDGDCDEDDEDDDDTDDDNDNPSTC